MSRSASSLLAEALQLLDRGDAWLARAANDTRAAGLTLAALVHLAILRALLIWTALLSAYAAGVVALIERGMSASGALLLAALACTATAVVLHLRWCARARQLGGRTWLRGLAGLLVTGLLARAAQAPPARPAPPPPAPDAAAHPPAA